MFIDQTNLKIKAGKGGDGMVAFRREKYVEKGGPAGGSGGRGSDIYFIAKDGLSTLLDLRYNSHINGETGENGRSKSQWGKNAEDIYIKVPVGTVVYNADTDKLIGDLTKDGQTLLIARGGRGGRGNIEFATSKNPAPHLAEKGEPGEYREIRVELKVLADVGLVGYPSVGKSTLISVVSAAKPKIAAYHFTTLVPNLGLVRVKDGRSFVMADLPGLIEGAHQGAGLGIQFLRHIERCRVILHVIDMSGQEGRDPYEDYLKINNELKQYKMRLLERPQIIVANKMDLPESQANLAEFTKKLADAYPIVPISGFTHQGVDQLLYLAADLLENTTEFTLEEFEQDEVVAYTFTPEERVYTVSREDDGTYNIEGIGLKRLFDMTDFSNEEAVKRFARQLRSFGLDEDLRKRGVQNGETVKIFGFEFEFID